MSVNLGFLMLELRREIRYEFRKQTTTDSTLWFWNSGIGAKRRKSYPSPFRVARACLDCSTHNHSQGKGRSSPQATHRTSAHTALSTISSVAMSLAFVEPPARGGLLKHIASAFDMTQACYAPYDCQYRSSDPH